MSGEKAEDKFSGATAPKAPQGKLPAPATIQEQLSGFFPEQILPGELYINYNADEDTYEIFASDCIPCSLENSDGLIDALHKMIGEGSFAVTVYTDDDGATHIILTRPLREAVP